MTTLDFLIETIGTIAGWSAVILGLAWALSRARRCDLHFHLPPAGGDGGAGGRPAAPPPTPGAFGRRMARLALRPRARRITADEWRARRDFGGR